jgi:hypothetical protein
MQGVKWQMFSVSSVAVSKEPVLMKHTLISLKLLSSELLAFTKCSHLSYPQLLWWDSQMLTVMMKVCRVPRDL